VTSLERTDGSIAIRPYREDDAGGLYEAARESIPEVGRWLPWCHPGYVLHEAREWIAATRAQLASGDGYHLAIVEPGGRLVGGVGLGPLVRAHAMANLGWWVRTSATGRGVATRAARLVVPVGFGLGLTRLEILVAVGNPASLRVAEKLGARREGVLRNRLKIGAAVHAAVCFSLVPDQDRL
jgi:RimJ/RimL family protein N-acetyltransferase